MKFEKNHLLPDNYLIKVAVIRPDHSYCYDAVQHVPAFTIEGEGMHWKVPLDKRWEISISLFNGRSPKKINK